MDLAQMLMFQQLAQAPPMADPKALAKPPMSDESPIAAMMRGPASEDDGNVLQLKKLQMSGAVPATPPAAQKAYEDYVAANSKGLGEQRDSLSQLKKLVEDNKQETNPLQNLFTAAHDTVTGGNKLQSLMAAQQAAQNGYITQNEAVQKAQGDITKHEVDLTEAKFKHEDKMATDKRQADQFKQLLGYKYDNMGSGGGAKIEKLQTGEQRAVRQLLESARGNPAVGQAEKDLQAADKFDALINLKGDPNKLSPQLVQLASSEIGKMASGGVPTIHELQGLNPDNLPKGLATAAQMFNATPSAANQGEFLKEYALYVGDLRHVAQGIITDKYGRIVEGSRDAVGEKNYENNKRIYVNRFMKDSASTQKPQAKGVDYNSMSDADIAKAYKASGGQ